MVLNDWLEFLNTFLIQIGIQKMHGDQWSEVDAQERIRSPIDILLMVKILVIYFEGLWGYCSDFEYMVEVGFETSLMIRLK